MPSETDIPGLFLPMLRWYFWDHPMRIVRRYTEFALAFRESFAILFLLKTLFSPWKSISDSYPTKGFNMQAIAETLFLNLTTRGIGAFIRLSAIVAGLLIQILLFTGSMVYLLWWYMFPAVAVVLPFYIVSAFFL